MPSSPDRLKELSAIERFAFSHSKLREVNFQDEDNLRAYTASFLVYDAILKRKKPQINGVLSKEGPRLVVANHTKMEDVFLMHWLSLVTADRTMRLVAKGNLVKDVKESAIMQNRRKEKSPFKKAISALGIDRFANRHIAAPYCRAFRVIPFNTGDQSAAMNMQSMQIIKKELAGGNIIGIFQTGTRKPPLDLLDALPLAANIASFHPDLPVTTVGISYNPFVINISPEQLTYKKVLAEHGTEVKSRREGLTIMSRTMADSIGNLIVDPSLRPAWWLERHGVYSEEELRSRYEAGQNLYKLYLEAQRSK